MRRALLAGLISIVVLAACSDAPRGGAPSVSLAQLNLLHGLFCPPESDHCRLPDRVALLFEFIVARGCPDVVTLEEVWPPAVDELQKHLASACPFTYQLVLGERRTEVDDEAVLSRYPVTSVEQRSLFKSFRRVLLTRVEHPDGLLDVYATHLASGSDGAGQPCGADCPPECIAAGAANVRDCQAVQMAGFIEQTHDPATLGLIAGDFNQRPGSFVYEQFVGRGWPDVYREASNPECDPATGIGCTSGRADEELAGLESPAIDETSRIDFIFLIRPSDPATCAADVVPPGRDGPGSGTRLFADAPNPFAAACGPLPEAICWPSDHIGVQVGIDCG